MIGDDEIKEMQEQISMMEKELNERKRELNEKRFGGLRSAIEARKEADKAILAELKNLGYSVYKSNWMF